MTKEYNLINPINYLDTSVHIPKKKNALDFHVGDAVMICQGRDGNYGKQMHSNRPGIILKIHGNDKLTVVFATTSKLQSGKHQFNVDVVIEGKTAVVRCDKIATVHISRVCRHMDTLSEDELIAVLKSIRKYLQKNKHMEAFIDLTDYESFYKRGHVYKINKTAPRATGTELGQKSYGLIVNNPAFLTKCGNVKETDTLVVSYGITQEKYEMAANKEAYVKHSIYSLQEKKLKLFYFNTSELYEVDRKRINMDDPMSYKGQLKDDEMKTLNKIIEKLTDIEPC